MCLGWSGLAGRGAGAPSSVLCRLSTFPSCPGSRTHSQKGCYTVSGLPATLMTKASLWVGSTRSHPASRTSLAPSRRRPPPLRTRVSGQAETPEGLIIPRKGPGEKTLTEGNGTFRHTDAWPQDCFGSMCASSHYAAWRKWRGRNGHRWLERDMQFIIFTFSPKTRQDQTDASKCT